MFIASVITHISPWQCFEEYLLSLDGDNSDTVSDIISNIKTNLANNKYSTFYPVYSPSNNNALISTNSIDDWNVSIFDSNGNKISNETILPSRISL